MANNHNGQSGGHFIIPFSVLRNVCIALLTLTALTVVAARMHLGMFEAPVAFLIAFVKAMLVMMFFMGLKYDEKLNRIIFSMGFIFLGLLFFFCWLDVYSRIAVSNTL